MKPHSITLPLLATLLVLMGMNFPSHADLYIPGAWMHIPPYFDGADAEITSWTLPNEQGNGAYLGLSIDESNPSYAILTPTPFGYTIGIGHNWYETTEDTIIDASFVTNTIPFFDLFPAVSGEIQMTPNIPFFMAFELGDAEDDYTSGHVYGWAELMWDGADLNLLDSAAENSGTGIIAGKYEVIPEPSTLALLGGGSIVIFTVRSRKNRLIEDHQNFADPDAKAYAENFRR